MEPDDPVTRALERLRAREAEPDSLAAKRATLARARELDDMRRKTLPSPLGEAIEEYMTVTGLPDPHVYTSVVLGSTHVVMESAAFSERRAVDAYRDAAAYVRGLTSAWREGHKS